MTTLIDNTAPRGPAQAAAGVERVDVAAVNATAARKLYASRQAIHPKLAHGLHRALKWVILFGALGVYYLLPWLRWPRAAGEPDQAVLVDFAGRRIYFFFIEIWPQEFYFGTGLLVLAAMGLFLTTALFGRLWCGFACPQTVWTDLFIAVERLIEGDRNARLRLAKQPWGPTKISKKAIKHAIWLAIALMTGGAWVLYFHDAPTIARAFFAGEAPASAYIFAGLLTFTTYALAGVMREQVCIYMCPWPRIQGAMTDRDTMQVTYKADRGEPRGAHKKGDAWDGRGDCIDCRQCVVVCPMGIDIRDGDQLECINCGLCADVCDDVMTKVGRPKGLIAWDSASNMAARARGEKTRLHLIRPRTVYYSLAILSVLAAMTWGLATRTTYDFAVLRDRAPNFVRLSDGSVRNGYTIKVVNKGDAARTFDVAIEGPAGASATFVGQNDGQGDGERLSAALRVEGNAKSEFRVLVTLPKAAIVGPTSPIVFDAVTQDRGERKRYESTFQTGAR